MSFNRKRMYFEVSVDGFSGTTTYFDRTASLLVALLQIFVGSVIYFGIPNIFFETAEEIALGSIVDRLNDKYEFDRADAFEARVRNTQA